MTDSGIDEREERRRELSRRKSKRYRERHPERVKMSKQKYLSIAENRAGINETARAWRDRNEEKYRGILFRQWCRKNAPLGLDEAGMRAEYERRRTEWWAQARNAWASGLTRAERRAAKSRLSRSEFRAWLSAFKVQKGCADCGYNGHHAALDFDHVTGEKAFNVTKAPSISAALQEIEKCEVVCANCHRVRTWDRRQETK